MKSRKRIDPVHRLRDMQPPDGEELIREFERYVRRMMTPPDEDELMNDLASLQEKRKKRSRVVIPELYHWLRPPGINPMPGDDLIDKHLAYPRVASPQHRFGPKSWRLIENDRLVFDVEARSELQPVYDRLMWALFNEDLLVQRVRETTSRAKKDSSKQKRDNEKARMILEETARLIAKRKPADHAPEAIIGHIAPSDACRGALTPRYASKMLKVVAFSSPVPSRKVALAWRASFDRPMAVETLAEAIGAIRMPCLKMAAAA